MDFSGRKILESLWKAFSSSTIWILMWLCVFLYFVLEFYFKNRISCSVYGYLGIFSLFRPRVRHSFSKSLPLARYLPHVGPGNGREESHSPTDLKLAHLVNVIGIFGRVFRNTEKKHQVGWS